MTIKRGVGTKFGHGPRTIGLEPVVVIMVVPLERDRGPMRNGVALAGLLAGLLCSTNAEAQAQASTEPSNVRNDSADLSVTSAHAAPAEFDDVRPTAKVTQGARTCSRGSDGEVVVCGRAQDDDFRLRPLSDQYQTQNLLGKTLDIKIAPGVHLYGLGIRVSF